MTRCPVCGGAPHPEYAAQIGGHMIPGCPAVRGNTRDRYLAERRAVAARGRSTGHLNDVVFDDLVSVYGSRRAAVEALCAPEPPPLVRAVAGPPVSTEAALRI